LVAKINLRYKSQSYEKVPRQFLVFSVEDSDELEFNFQFYPSPVSQYLNVEVSNLSLMQVFDATGILLVKEVLQL